MTLIIATNALELGVDIGLLQCSLHIGYPGSISSFYQQVGRAGRYIAESEGTIYSRRALSIFIGLSSPLDQYFMANPQDFFSRQHERVVINPENRDILSHHLIYSASEEPFVEETELNNSIIDDQAAVPFCSTWFGESSKTLLKSLLKNKMLFSVWNPTAAAESAPLVLAGINAVSWSFLTHFKEFIHVMY